jgi:DNA-binding GntR family transcriptional regulator
LLALIEQLRREDRRRYIEQVANQAIRAAMHDDHAAILAAADAGDLTAALAALSRHLRLTEGERK